MVDGNSLVQELRRLNHEIGSYETVISSKKQVVRVDQQTESGDFLAFTCLSRLRTLKVSLKHISYF